MSTPRVGNRFIKGRSGNPGGRPRAHATPPASAFDIVINRLLTVVQGGQTREITVDEALQQKTYHEAIAGSRMAQRVILKMIDKREKVLATKTPSRRNVIVRKEGGDPSNANSAMLLLNIAEMSDDRGHLKLQLTSWAVQEALARRARTGLTAKELADAKRNSLEQPKIKWPRANDQ